MLPQDQDRVVVVLVRARNPNNIGAVARAMHDFGFAHLRLVTDYAVPFQTARSAVDASAVLAAAVEYTSLAEATADCTLVVGTTAVGERALQHPLHELPQAGSRIRAALAESTSRVALLFGSEKTGLSNDELSHCHWLLTIRMQAAAEGGRHPSMNLGQAAAVCLFELVRDAAVPVAVEAAGPSGADLERLSQLLGAVLEEVGYARRHPGHCDPAQLRWLTRRIARDGNDGTILMGMLRQILWKIGQQKDGAG